MRLFLVTWGYRLLALFLGICAFYGWIDSYPLLDNNEGLYAQIPFEMLERGDWVIPYLNGIPYLEKPPLLYWGIALLYSIFGKSVLLARCVPSTFGFLLCIFVYGFLRRLGYRREAPIAYGLMCSSFGMMLFSRMVFFDMVLASCVGCALMAFYLWYQFRTLFYLRLVYFMAAMSLLAKGFVGPVLIGGTIITFLCLRRDKVRLWDWWGVFLFLLCALPWHILASFRQQGFAWFYFVNEHVLRFLNMRIPKDYYEGPWHYYIPRVLGYVFPFSFSLLSIVRKPQTALSMFCVSWFGFSLVFFSFSGAKANYYMIVGIAPLLILLSLEWYRRTHYIIISIRVALVMLAFGAAGYICYTWNEIPIGIFILGVAPFFTRQPLLLCVISVSLFCFFLPFVSRFEDTISSHALAQRICQEGKKPYLYRRYEEISSMGFYCKGVLPLIDYASSDLWYGRRLLAKADEKMPGAGYDVVVHEKDMRAFKSLYPRYACVYKSGKKYVCNKEDALC